MGPFTGNSSNTDEELQAEAERRKSYTNDMTHRRSNAMNQFHQAVREWEAARNSRDLIRMPIGIPPTYETDINAYTDEELRKVFVALRVPLVCRFKSVKNQLIAVKAMRDMGFMVGHDFIKLRATWMRHTIDAELDRVKIRE